MRKKKFFTCFHFLINSTQKPTINLRTPRMAKRQQYRIKIQVERRWTWNQSECRPGTPTPTSARKRNLKHLNLNLRNWGSSVASAKLPVVSEDNFFFRFHMQIKILDSTLEMWYPRIWSYKFWRFYVQLLRKYRSQRTSSELTFLASYYEHFYQSSFPLWLN